MLSLIWSLTRVLGSLGNAGIPSQRPPEWAVYILVNTVPRVSKFHLSEERILNSIKDPHISRYHTILYYTLLRYTSRDTLSVVLHWLRSQRVPQETYHTNHSGSASQMPLLHRKQPVTLHSQMIQIGYGICSNGRVRRWLHPTLTEDFFIWSRLCSHPLTGWVPTDSKAP